MKPLKIFIFTISFFVLTAAIPVNKYDAKIAVVDVESILENSLAIANIRKSMDERLENIQKEISDKEKEFKNYEADLILRKDTLSEEKFKELADEFNKKVGDVQKNIQTRKLALEQARGGAIQKVHETTIFIISELAKKYDLNIVLPSNQVLFVTNELNITHEVIASLNEKLKEVEIK